MSKNWKEASQKGLWRSNTGRLPTYMRVSDILHRTKMLIWAIQRHGGRHSPTSVAAWKRSQVVQLCTRRYKRAHNSTNTCKSCHFTTPGSESPAMIGNKVWPVLVLCTANAWKCIIVVPFSRVARRRGIKMLTEVRGFLKPINPPTYCPYLVPKLL